MTENSDNFIALQSEGDLNISPRRADWSKENIDDQTRKWLDADAKYFLHQSLSTPCLNVLQGCEGIYLQDLQGRRYMDFHGNNVHQVGFGNERVIQAIKDQLDELPFCTRRYTNIPAIKLAEKLTTLAPGDLNKVLFAPGGTSAIGIALKLTRYATGRFKTISTWDSFHGASLDAVSIGGETIFRKDVGPLLPGTEHVPPPDCPRCFWDCQDNCNLKCADYVDYIMEKEGDVAAFIAETVRSTSSVPPEKYWKKIRQICDKHGALLILDEIPHCLGRTGKMFTCEHFDIVPDILVIGKGLGGGVFPHAAVLAREHLAVAGDRALGHYTHEKNPVACAAALATIEYIEENQLCENAAKIGSHALGRLRQMQKIHSHAGPVRGIGLLLGMEIVHDQVSNQPATDLADKMMYAALSKGLSFKVTMSSILTLTPALTITIEQMDQALDIIEQCLKEL